MAFCSNCGAPLGEGAKFCTSCGSVVATAGAPATAVAVAPVLNAQPVQPSMYEQSVEMRKESLNELSRMIDYFGRKQQQYIEYDQCNARLNKIMRGTSAAPLVWGIIISSFTLLPLLLLASELVAGRTRSGNLVGFITFGFVFLIGIGLIVLYICKKAGRGKEKTRLLARVGQLATELTSYFMAFGYSPLGAEYTNPEILTRIADVLRSGRADSPKEAVNIMLVDSRRSMMQLQAALSGQAARQVSAGAASSAVFCAASFFRR